MTMFTWMHVVTAIQNRIVVGLCGPCNLLNINEGPRAMTVKILRALDYHPKGVRWKIELCNFAIHGSSSLDM